MSTRGQIVLPAALRERDELQAGDIFDVERVAPGHYELVRRRQGSTGLLAWLTSCPEPGYFEPIESDDTDSVGAVFAP